MAANKQAHLLFLLVIEISVQEGQVRHVGSELHATFLLCKGGSFHCVGFLGCGAVRLRREQVCMLLVQSTDLWSDLTDSDPEIEASWERHEFKLCCLFIYDVTLIGAGLHLTGHFKLVSCWSQLLKLEKPFIHSSPLPHLQRTCSTRIKIHWKKKVPRPTLCKRKV